MDSLLCCVYLIIYHKIFHETEKLKAIWIFLGNNNNNIMLNYIENAKLANKC